MTKMSNIVDRSCRICFKSCNDYIVTDSTCFVKIFIQITGLKDFNEKLWLCTWCKATLKRTVYLVKLASITEKATFESASKENRNLYNLSYTHNPHIDIPPSQEQVYTHTNHLDNSNSKVEEPENSKIQESSNSILADEIPQNNTSRKKMNYDHLKFEMKHLNSKEQLNEIELKKVKNRNMKYMCDYCGNGFLTVDLFEEHKLRHSDVSGLYKCTICQLRFKSSDVLSQHMLSHKRRFRCLICDAVFNRWSHCSTHRYKCGGGFAPAPCEYCLKIFSDEHSLNVHIKGVHKKVKKYICEQCRMGFASKQRLTVHMRSHTGFKPFSCARCPRTFTTNSNLRAHSTVHDDVSRHYCVECNTRYKSAKSLKRHFEQSSRHIIMNDARYLCKQCSKQFPSEKSLNHHIEVRHNTTYRCTRCNKTFSNNTNLNKHVKCIHTSLR